MDGPEGEYRHLRELVALYQTMTEKALELQARVYELQLAALTEDMKTARQEIAKLRYVALGAWLLGAAMVAVGSLYLTARGVK